MCGLVFFCGGEFSQSILQVSQVGLVYKNVLSFYLHVPVNYIKLTIGFWWCASGTFEVTRDFNGIVLMHGHSPLDVCVSNHMYD